jgi:hypothetical protein
MFLWGKCYVLAGEVGKGERKLTLGSLEVIKQN